MKTMFRRIMAYCAAAFLWSAAAFAQAPEATASWKVSTKEIGDTTSNKYNPTALELDSPSGYSPIGEFTQSTAPVKFKDDDVFFDTAVFTQRVKLEGDEATVAGEITWSGCNDQFCAAPEHWEFSTTLGASSPDGGSTPFTNRSQGTSSDRSLSTSSDRSQGTSSDRSQGTSSDRSLSGAEGPEYNAATAGNGSNSLWGLIIEEAVLKPSCTGSSSFCSTRSRSR